MKTLANGISKVLRFAVGSLLVAAAVLLTARSAEAQATVSGCLTYGTINTVEPNDIHQMSMYSRGLSTGSPVQFVTVELHRSTGLKAGEDETDENGCFSISDVTQSPNTLRVEARNHYVNVKEAKPVPLPTDLAISVEFDVGDAFDGSPSEVNLGTLSISDTDDTFTSWYFSYPVSRAMFVATSVYRAGRHIEEVTGESLGDVWVRLGFQLRGAWYDKYLVYLAGGAFMNRTIHLEGDEAATIDHEYGHVIEDDIGAFGVWPSYGSHNNCVPMNTILGDPGVCWSFLEGLASWYGAVNSYGFETVGDVPFFGPIDCTDDSDWAETSLLAPLGRSAWIENSNDACDSGDRAGWADPRAVESVVAQVLWDLVDCHPDASDQLATGVPEVAEVSIDDVLDVIRADIPINAACGSLTFYSNPVTLEQFCEEYVDRHREDTDHGVFPDLYAAYAFNGVAVDCAADTEAPDAVSIESSSHPEGGWRNTTSVALRIIDGDDDFSGSYYYYRPWDNDPSGEPDGTIGSEDLIGKSTEYAWIESRPEGDHQYLHVRTRDLAGHLGATAHYGPVRIDITPPVFLSTTFPAAGSQFVIGRFVHFEWTAFDALSGVARVRLDYDDPANGRSALGVEAMYGDAAVNGVLELYLNPDVYVPTTTAIFSLTVEDHAGNQTTVTAPAITIVSPFAGPNMFGIDTTDGRVVSGDLNGDGRDEIVLSGTVLGARVLKVINVSPAVAIQNVVPGLSGGDLFLADTDRDGDLDLVAAGDFGGATPEIYLYENTVAGILVSRGALPLAGFPDMVVRVVDLNGTGEPILVYGGRRTALDAKLRTYNFVSGAMGLIDEIVFRGGDFEVGDIDHDAFLDFVVLNVDNGVAGSGSITWYEGTDGTNEEDYVALGGMSGLAIIDGDVDLGNWDRDADLDLFIQYRTTDGVTSEDHTEMYEWWQPGFFLEAEAGPERHAEGDGHVVEIYNDGFADAMSFGRKTTGALAAWYETNSEFGERGSGLPVPVRSGLLFSTDTAWGDFDGDRDLDFVVAGKTSAGVWRTRWYSCLTTQNGEPNENPAPPTALVTEYDPALGGFFFRWTPPVATDETARAAFRYEIRIGTTPGAQDVMTWAHPAAFSQQPAGTALAASVERFVPLAAGTYYWSVRTVDVGWRRSMAPPDQNTAAAVACATVPGDCDGDGIRDACETDTDGDGSIDECDDDDDNDGVNDGADTDPLDPFACGDVDFDGCDDCVGGDGFGVLPDTNPGNDGPDFDADGLCDGGDPCPVDRSNDSDLDGVCDSADICPGGDDLTDTDLDGTPDGCDACPLDATGDNDGDGVCDSADACAGFDDAADDDGDGVADACDPCPFDALDDSDGDGSCDSDDACSAGDDRVDSDTDLVADACDPCPADNPNDSDLDFVCDSADVCPGGDDADDADGDTVPDTCDNCPAAANSGQRDGDADGIGDVCDTSDGTEGDAPKFIKGTRSR